MTPYSIAHKNRTTNITGAGRRGQASWETRLFGLPPRTTAKAEFPVAHEFCAARPALDRSLVVAAERAEQHFPGRWQLFTAVTAAYRFDFPSAGGCLAGELKD